MGEWFFAIDVFAASHCFHSNGSVHVIWGGNVHSINVVAHLIEHFAVISEHGFARPSPGDFLEIVGVDIAIAHHIHFCMSADAFDIFPALVIAANAGKIESGIGGFGLGDICHNVKGFYCCANDGRGILKSQLFISVASIVNLAQGSTEMRLQMLRIFSLGMAVSAILNSGWAKDEGGVLPSNHQRLGYYLDTEGKEQPVKATTDWEVRRGQILKGFQEASGMLPSRKNLPALEIRIKATEDREKHVRQTIDFISEEGDRSPCYLYLPKGIKEGERRPAIVALHPTHKIGKDVTDGLSQRPNRAYAKELADRGYVVIAPDYLSFGEYADYDFEKDRYSSGTMKAIWNHMRCVDLLQARGDVDGERIGAIGHSLGGHNAIFLGVMDARIKVVVSSCGWTPFHDYKAGDITGWTSNRYMPSLKKVYGLDVDKVPFDFHELIAALAPRAFFSNSPLHDSNFDYRGIEKAAPEIRKIYNLYGVADKMRIAYPDAQHDFPTQVREESYRFLDRFLKTETKSNP